MTVTCVPPDADENGRPVSRHGRPPSLPPSGRDGSLPPASVAARPGTPHASREPSREPTPPPGKRSSSSRPSVGGVLRALSPANFLPKLALGGPKKPEDPIPNTPRRPSPRRFVAMRGAAKEGGGACVTPRIKGVESPSGPPVQPLKEVNRDLNSQTPQSHPSTKHAIKEQAPAAVRAPSPRQPAPRANAGHREMLEVQVVAKQLLAEVYHTEVSEDTVFSTLQSYPEIAWLAHCASRCPQPPCWGRYDAEEGTGGEPCFINSQTGEASPQPPLLRHFAHLAALALQARQEGKIVKPDLHRALEQVRADSELAKTAWDGPHLDTQSGAHYWFSADLGCSTWGDPAAAADFLARVISELLGLLPTSSAKEPQPSKKDKEPQPPKKEREPTPQEKEEKEKEDALATIAQEIRELQHGKKKEETAEPEIQIKRPEGPLREPTPPPRAVQRRSASLPRNGAVDSCAPSPRAPNSARPHSPKIPCKRPSSVEPFFGQSSKAPEMQIFEDASCRPGSPSRTSQRRARPRTARILKLPDEPDEEDKLRRPRAPSTPCARGRNRLRLPACFEDSDAEKENAGPLNEAELKEKDARKQEVSPPIEKAAVFNENATPTSPSIFDVPPSPTLIDISHRSRECHSPPSPSIIIVDEGRVRSPPRCERPGSRRGRGRSRERSRR